jgi:hypothetical protein
MKRGIRVEISKQKRGAQRIKVYSLINIVLPWSPLMVTAPLDETRVRVPNRVFLLMVMMRRGNVRRTSNVPADSLPTTNVRGTFRFDGGAVSAARAVARNALSDTRGGIAKYEL